MNERKPKWTPEEIARFDLAWEYLDARTQEIKDIVNQFTSENAFGFKANYSAELFKWGNLQALIPIHSKQKAERLITKPTWWSLGDVPQMPVHMINEDEARSMGDFAAEVGNKFDLRVKRIGFETELVTLQYSLKPNFENF